MKAVRLATIYGAVCTSLSLLSILVASAQAAESTGAAPVSKPAEDVKQPDKNKTQNIPAGRPVNIGKQKTMQLPAPPSFFYIDKLGKQAIPYMFYEGGDFRDGLAPVLIADQWGFVDKEGNVEIGADFDMAGKFAEGLAPVKVKDKWGYIDRAGKLVIQPRFAAAENFKNGYAVVQLGKDSPEFPQKASDQLQTILKDPDMPALKKAWLAIASSRAAGIINKKGEFVFDPFYSSIQNFSDDLALAKEGSTIVFLNKKGEVTLRPSCQDAKPFSEGLAAIKVKDKWGFINTKGSVAVKPIYDDVEDFQKGMAAASLNRKWGFINKTGKWVIQPKYDVVWEGFQSGIAIVGKDMCPIENTHADVTRVGSGFLVSRRKGNTRDFDESTTPLEPGYFAYPDYRFTLIDKDENVISDKQFDHVGPLSDGARVVRMDGKLGYIDNSGNTVIKPSYKSAESFSEGLALVKEGVTKPRSVGRNETLLRHSVPALVNDPELIRKDIAVCSEVIKKDPSNAQAFRDRGYLLCSLSRFNDSLPDFDQVIELCSSSSEGYYWRGMANMQLSRYAEAAIDFTNAIQMEPNKPQNLFGRALSLRALRRGQLALIDINRAIAMYDHAYYHRIRGEILQDLGHDSEALLDLQAGRKAPSLEPWPVGPKSQDDLVSQSGSLHNKLKTVREENPDNHAQIALLAAELADTLDELRRLKSRADKVLEIEDLSTRIVELRREALKQAEASTTGGAAPLVYKADLSNALAHLASWYVRTREYSRASALYDEALSLAKDIESPLKEADYLVDIGKMYAAQKQYEKAQEHLKRALILTRNPVDAPAKVVRAQTLNAYAIVLAHLKNPTDANISMKEASQLLDLGADIAFLPSPPALPDNASGEESYELALQCKSLGLIETSRNYMKKAIERSTSSKVKSKAERFLTAQLPKRSIDLRLTKSFQKGRTAELTGDFLNAEKWYKVCIDAAPDFEWPYVAMGRIKRLEGDLAQAEKMVRKALSINSGCLDAWLELARIDSEQGDVSRARQSVDKALQLDPDSQLAQFEQRQLTTN